MKPRRVQRKRTKGFKLPPNTVCVNRGTQWGNPFPVNGDVDAAMSCKLFQSFIDNLRKAGRLAEYLAPLRGKNLACFCPEDAEHCHADILLHEANLPEPEHEE